MIEPDPRPGGLRLVVCSIRDEFFQRPAALAHEWPNENGGAKLLGGKCFFSIFLYCVSQFIISICKFGLLQALISEASSHELGLWKFDFYVLTAKLCELAISNLWLTSAESGRWNSLRERISSVRVLLTSEWPHFKWLVTFRPHASIISRGQLFIHKLTRPSALRRPIQWRDSTRVLPNGTIKCQRLLAEKN